MRMKRILIRVLLALVVGWLAWGTWVENTQADDANDDDAPSCGEYCAETYEPPEYVPGEGGW